MCHLRRYFSTSVVVTFPSRDDPDTPGVHPRGPVSTHNAPLNFPISIMVTLLSWRCDGLPENRPASRRRPDGQNPAPRVNDRCSQPLKSRVVRKVMSLGRYLKMRYKNLLSFTFDHCTIISHCFII